MPIFAHFGDHASFSCVVVVLCVLLHGLFLGLCDGFFEIIDLIQFLGLVSVAFC